MSYFFRGIISHATAWLIVLLVAPFIFHGFTRDSLLALGWVPALFLFGLIPLVFGSALWMLPFISSWCLSHCLPVYHLWVAVGAFIAVFLYVEMQFTGDLLPPAKLYYAPSALAFLVALVASLTYARSRLRFGRLT